MKYLFTFFFSFYFLNVCQAQQSNLANTFSSGHFVRPHNDFHASHNNTQSVNSFYLDYDSADARIFGSAHYTRYVWPLNSNYTAADNAMRYCIVAFDSLYDAYNNITYPRDSVGNLAVDSIFLNIGQENNSGIDDTLIVNIIGIDSLHGYPQPSVQYWSSYNIIIPPNAALTGDWRTTVPFKFTPFASVLHNRFAIELEYFGSKLDTLGVVAGFGFRDTCSATSLLNADTTHFSKVRKQSSGDSLIANSFALWSQYQSIGLLPTPNGSNIYFDCNQNGQYDGGSDGESYIQNIQFVAHVKTNAAGINELKNDNLSVAQNFPNPAGDKTQITYSLKQAAEVSFFISDVTGKIIMEKNEGMLSRGDHVIAPGISSLDNGIYFYTIVADGSRITKKMTVMH